jgi:hypothetical protein
MSRVFQQAARALSLSRRARGIVGQWFGVASDFSGLGEVVRAPPSLGGYGGQASPWGVKRCQKVSNTVVENDPPK